MGRKKLNLTEAKIEKMLLHGRGIGKGSEYQLWLKNGDFSSKGRSSRVKSTKFNRIHHTFSDLETNFLYTLLWDDSIVDIREQYSLLPVSETEEIDNVLGIKYPKPPKHEKDEEEKIHVMTTDFLVTKIEDGVEFFIAYCVKMEKDLLNSRTLQKIAIEEAYWNKRNVKFKIITENSFSREKAKNIKRIVNKITLPLDEFITSEEFYTVSSKLKESIIEYYDENKILSNICKQIEDAANIYSFEFGEKTGYIEVKDGAVRMLEMDKDICSEGICSKTGWIKEEYETIVCMPNGISVNIKNDENNKEKDNDIDMVA